MRHTIAWVTFGVALLVASGATSATTSLSDGVVGTATQYYSLSLGGTPLEDVEMVPETFETNGERFRIPEADEWRPVEVVVPKDAPVSKEAMVRAMNSGFPFVTPVGRDGIREDCRPVRVKLVMEQIECTWEHQVTFNPEKRRITVTDAGWRSKGKPYIPEGMDYILLSTVFMAAGLLFSLSGLYRLATVAFGGATFLLPLGGILASANWVMLSSLPLFFFALLSGALSSGGAKRRVHTLITTVLYFATGGLVLFILEKL